MARGSDPGIGPIYIEGALPGDTLVVHLLKLRTNRATAHQGSRINAHAATLQYDEAAKYDPAFDGEYQLDPVHNVARLTHPSEHLGNFWVPIKPMLGCISVAPSGQESLRGTDLGAWGGNMDYNGNGEGATLYFPVFQPGALLAARGASKEIASLSAGRWLGAVAVLRRHNADRSGFCRAIGPRQAGEQPEEAQKSLCGPVSQLPWRSCTD